MVNSEEIHQQAEGPAMILGIGTATPTNFVLQDDYPDYYFRITNSTHLTKLKDKFKRICDRSQVRKRHFYYTEEILKKNPDICTHNVPSLGARQRIAVVEIPKLAAEAANKAISEWSRPMSSITHLIFCTTSSVNMPGTDYSLAKLLGLPNSINRLMLHMQGCFAGGTVLRVAKDIAENNRGARVLVVCSEITAVTFRGPSEADLSGLVGQALFGDGASAVIVGADPDLTIERPLYELVWARQTMVPGTEGAIEGHLTETGLMLQLVEHVPQLVMECVEDRLLEAFGQLGISDWNEIFWVMHPGGPAILDGVEAKLGLNNERLRASREVLKEFGNMSSACVLFILDEMRRGSLKAGKATTGDGLEFGVLFGFGPGLTVETLVLRSRPTVG